MMVELRKSKGMTREEASRLIEDPLYLGVMMIKNGDADGEVSGADHATGDVLASGLPLCKDCPGNICCFRRFYNDSPGQELR